MPSVMPRSSTRGSICRTRFFPRRRRRVSHTVCRLRPSLQDAEIATRAERGFVLRPLSAFYDGPTEANALLLGHAPMNPAEIRREVGRFAATLRPLRRPLHAALRRARWNRPMQKVPRTPVARTIGQPFWSIRDEPDQETAETGELWAESEADEAQAAFDEDGLEGGRAPKAARAPGS